jgi:hypothetical protein
MVICSIVSGPVINPVSWQKGVVKQISLPYGGQEAENVTVRGQEQAIPFKGMVL